VEFRLEFSTEARDSLLLLSKTASKKYRKVQKILGLMETNLRHPSLKTHKYDSLCGPNGEEIFEAYVENRTSGAWRIFWYYGPSQTVITILAITPHP
jgi:hypothetical protein